MKSLNKTFDILEYVVMQSGRSVNPIEIARNTNLNIATCTRILGNLVERGYIEKVSRKDGYIPGPMIFGLTTRKNIYQELANAANEPLRLFAEEIRTVINLSVINNDSRIMLCLHSSEFNWEPWQRLRFDIEAGPATDLLLLSRFTPKKAKEVIDKMSSVLTMEKLNEVKKNKYIWYRHKSLNVCIMGHLIELDNYPTCAVGFGFSDKYNVEDVLALLKQTVKQIENNLNKTHNIIV